MRSLFLCLLLISCSSELASAPDGEAVTVVNPEGVVDTDQSDTEVDAGVEAPVDAGASDDTNSDNDTDTDSDSDVDSEQCTEHEFRPHPHEDEPDHSYHHREKCND